MKIKHLKKIQAALLPVWLSFFAFFVVGCASVNTSKNIQTKHFESKPVFLGKMSEKEKIAKFEKQFLKSHIAIMIINDKGKFLDGDLKSYNKKCLDESYQQLYPSFQKASKQLVEKHPEKIDLWLSQIDFLYDTVRKIYNYPERVSFNPQNISSSTAMKALSAKNAKKLETIIRDKKFSPLMEQIGLPSLDENNRIVDNLAPVAMVAAFYEMRVQKLCKQK